MKRIIVSILVIFVVLLICSGYFLYTLKNNKIIEQREYNKYKNYINKDVSASELITLINKVIDSNEQNNVEKNKKGMYLENGTNSINLEIKFIDFQKLIAMESISEKGESEFLKYYGLDKFRCTKVEYHKSTNQVKYFFFEQIEKI